MTDIQAITMPGVHERFLEFFMKKNEPAGLKILDLGAGQGAFSKRLYELGYDVHACDLFPEVFRFEEIECKKVDITDTFPYEDHSFDIVIAIEVSEHIIDHGSFFSEIHRILKPEGRFYMSTPNVLTMRSRVRFLLRGFHYSFGPLEMDRHDGLQHVCSRTLDQYNYIAMMHGFEAAQFDIDRVQSASLWLLRILYPAMFLYRIIKRKSRIHNHRKLLIGRLLFMVFRRAA